MSKERLATVKRVTGETDVTVSINLDGTGICKSNTGIYFLDHMIQQIASHGLFDLDIQATGDWQIDDHHTNEDVGITLGQALHQALGNKKGIARFGHFIAPLDEALIQVALDFSGRPHLSYGLHISTERVGTYDTQLVREFFVALVNHSQMTYIFANWMVLILIILLRLPLRPLPEQCAWPWRLILVALKLFLVRKACYS